MTRWPLAAAAGATIVPSFAEGGATLAVVAGTLDAVADGAADADAGAVAAADAIALTDAVTEADAVTTADAVAVGSGTVAVIVEDGNVVVRVGPERLK